VTDAGRLARWAALPVAAGALALAALAVAHGSRPLYDGSWLLLDDTGGLFLAVSAMVGLAGVLLSPAYLRGREGAHARGSEAWYYGVLFAFWLALLAVPLCANLALAWLIIDATTASSALLVAFSGRREALEAGWKYLILTALGLSLALLGIIVIGIAQALIHHHDLSALSFGALRRDADLLPHGTILAGFVLLIAGLAVKIGWAPVHNWLPDAHSEAPAPVSALLSAALLPTVTLVAWRVKDALAPALGARTAATVFIAFGVASILIAIPFLWRTMPWKRLLAYSTLEHMGIIAVGIGFGSRLALTGVAIHVAGHAFGKALGFYSAMPLGPDEQPTPGHPRPGLLARRRLPAIGMGISLGTLAGLPPSPLFVSELLIVLGGIATGHAAVSIVVAAALALGFLGLLHAMLEGVVGDDAPGRVLPAAEVAS